MCQNFINNCLLTKKDRGVKPNSGFSRVSVGVRSFFHRKFLERTGVRSSSIVPFIFKVLSLDRFFYCRINVAHKAFPALSDKWHKSKNS